MVDGEGLPDWDQIVERHSARVVGVAMRILGSVEDAEDVAQEVFVEAFRLHSGGPVQSWTGLLVRMATLRAIDRLRRVRPHAELQEGDGAWTVEPFEEAAAAELAEWLREAVGRLPDQQAAAFAMHWFEHFTRDEIAASLEISPAAVSTALNKARQRLHEQLAVYQRGETR
jgi:RNA polymerase sigma-70 factor (ECF subfamily)